MVSEQASPSRPRTICVVTGSRADYGLLASPMAAIQRESGLRLQLIATGQHLVRDAGETLAAIEADGFEVDRTVPLEIDGDGPLDIGRGMGRGVIGFAEAFAALRSDILLVLGDRYEILAAASAALLARLPVAHIAGGDVTTGAVDDSIRHALTKLSHIHFATNAESARRIRQLGEDPEQIHIVGSPGIDNILSTAPLTRTELFASIGLAPCERNLLVTFHPETATGDSIGQMRELLGALEELPASVGLICTGSNIDVEGATLTEMMRAFAASSENAVFVASLGQKRYYSALRYVDAVVGNSSSGLYEAPSLAIPTVNIGMRQDGRLKARSVVDSPCERSAILSAIRQAFAMNCEGVSNPYGDGMAGTRIAAILSAIGEPARLLAKRFHDVPGEF